MKNKNDCVICDGKIDFKKEEYVRMTDFTGKKQTGECFYHLKCWKNRFQISQQKIQQDAQMWLVQMQNIVKGLMQNEVKTVDIK